MLNLYPPMFFMRARITHLAEDFSRCSVVVRRSRLTRNLHGSTFGGAVFCGADPIYPILLWQAMALRGIKTAPWLASASIEYLAPARKTLHMEFQLDEGLLEHAAHTLETEGRFSHEFETIGVDPDGLLCARIRSKVALRKR